MRWVLQTRAWLIFIGYTAVRIVNVVNKTGWFERVLDCKEDEAEVGNCLYKYNTELRGASEDRFRSLLTIILLLCGLICVLSYKWRWMTDLCCYLECLTRITAGFIPNMINQNQTAVQLSMHTVITMVGFYNDSRGHLVSLLVLQCYQAFFITHYVYLKSLDVLDILNGIWVTLIAIFCMVTFLMAIFYISQLHQKLEFTN